MWNTQDQSPRTHDVVVGVDGTAASANAARYAAREALRTGGQVDVHHVIAHFTPIAGMFPIPPEDLDDAGRATLAATLEQLGDVVDDVPIRTHLRHGSVVTILVEAARHAQTVVVGSDRRPASMRLLSGNVSTGVAARAAVPVVSVPETWRGDRTTGVIVAGIKHLDHADAALAEAFAVAGRAGSRLRVLHAWRFPAAYDDIVVSDPASLTEWRVRAERELEALVAPWRCAHPDVEVELRTVHDYAAQALVAASEDADELVIVRRAHGVPAAAHLGSTARTVLLYAHCPVRIVPSLPAPVMRDLDLEAAGAALKRSMA